MSEDAPAPAPAPDPGPAPASAPALPGVVRWKLMAGGALLLLAFLFAGVGPIARRAAERGLERGVGAKVTVASASFSPFAGRLTLHGVEAKDPKDPSRVLFQAEEAEASLDLGEALRGRVVVDRLRLTKAKAHIVRNEDGTLNIEHAPGAGGEGAGPPGPPGMPGEPPKEEKSRWEDWHEKARKKAAETDWVDQFQRWMERLRELEEWRKRRREEERRAPGPPPVGDPYARASWLFEDRASVVVREIVAEDCEIVLEDRANRDAKPVKVERAKLRVAEVSNAPSVHAEPIRGNLEGTIEDRSVALSGTLDLRRAGGASDVRLKGLLSAASLDALFKSTIPVTFAKKTTVDVDIPVAIDGFAIDTRPILRLDSIEAAARRPGQPLTSLGLTSDQLARGLTQVGTLDLRDLRVYGPVYDPAVDLGSSLKNLVVQALRAMGEKILDEAQQEAERRAKEQIERARRRAEEEAAKKLGGKVPVPVPIPDKLPDNPLDKLPFPR